MSDEIDNIEKTLKQQLEEDSYYINFLSDEDLVVVNKNIEKLAAELDIKDLPLFKSLKGHVARRVKYFALKSSCRRLAEICFSKGDYRHGHQVFGRELKRWAAIQMGELFTEKALRKNSNDYWHEY